MTSISDVQTAAADDSIRIPRFRLVAAGLAASMVLMATCLVGQSNGAGAGTLLLLELGNLLVLGALFAFTVRYGFSPIVDRARSAEALAAAGAALRASEARLKLALQASNVGLWDWDLLTNRVYFSPEWKRQIGYEDDEVGSDYAEWESRLHPDDRDRAIAALRAFIEDPDAGYDVEFRLRHRNGSYRWIASRAMLLHEQGRPVRMLGCHVDVTDRKATETALRDTAEEIAMAVRAAGMGIWKWDSRTNRLTHSHVTGPISRFNPTTEAEFFERVHEADRDLVRDRIRLALEQGGPYVAEFRIVMPDGSIRHVMARGERLTDASGAVMGLRGVDLDITEKKQLEEQVRQAQKMEAIGRLTGGIAHDFNNLLTAILGYVELLLERCPRGGPVHADLIEIQKAARSAAALTGQLLAFSRRQHLEPTVLDLNSVIRSMEGLLRRVIGKDVALSIVLDPALPPIYADRSQMEQVVMNLAVNARDAMPDGGMLTIETGRSVVRSEALAFDAPPGDMDAVVLKVSDTGVGMSEEVRGRIFEPFFTTKGHGKGTGLGLATVFGVVKQSGGFIDVASREGRGTTFTIVLPATSAPVRPPDARPVKQPRVRRGSETVLVVDDEPAIRQMAARALEQAGYRVYVAGTADEALAIGAGVPLDLLVTDVVLPGGADGRELARALVERWPAIKVLFVSGYASASVLQRQGKELAGVLLAKPFVPSALLEKVREVLDGA